MPKLSLTTLSRIACALGSWLLLRCYVTYPQFYLKLPLYLSGHERLPFQERVLPIFLLSPLVHSTIIHRIAATRVGPLADPNRCAFFAFSVVPFLAAVYFCVKLYHAVSRARTLEFLVLPIFFYAMTWTYVLHIEANFSYPYDVPSVAFFTAGLYFIYLRRFIPLLLVMALGTLNRETVLFLIGIYILDAASVPTANFRDKLRERFRLSSVPWARVALLSLVWLGLKTALFYRFRQNDRSEDYNRILENLWRVIKPNYWPVLLNMCGYLLPIIWYMRARLRPQRFANYLYILGPWILIMFWSGVIFETRIYGELCGFAAVAMVLILEQSVESLSEAGAATAVRGGHELPKPR